MPNVLIQIDTAIVPCASLEHRFLGVRGRRCRFSLNSGGDDPNAWGKAVQTATVLPR